MCSRKTAEAERGERERGKGACERSGSIVSYRSLLHETAFWKVDCWKSYSIRKVCMTATSSYRMIIRYVMHQQRKISALNYKGRQHLTVVRSLDTLDTSTRKIGISTEKNSAIELRRDHAIHRHITGHIIGTCKKQNELLHRWAAAEYRRTRGLKKETGS